MAYRLWGFFVLALLDLRYKGRTLPRAFPMPAKTKEEARERAARYMARAKRAGLQRITYWVPSDQIREVEILLSPFVKEARERLKTHEQQLSLLDDEPAPRPLR
jgi:hypothetical protein